LALILIKVKIHLSSGNVGKRGNMIYAEAKLNLLLLAFTSIKVMFF